MTRRFPRLFSVVAILTLLGLALGAALPSRAQGDAHTFPETGHTVSGVFWQYWQAHGGLAQQGYPISDPIQEKSDLNGQTYQVQYFERAVFELHPENQPPYNVLLSQLGTFRYKAKYGDAGAPGQQADPTNGRYFPETKHTVGGAFRTYWEQHGGLAQQGYPISDEFTEISDLNGQPYTVQYFERAVFERHPENAAPYDVLLSQLGTFQHRAKYEGGQGTVGPVPAPPTAAPAAPTSIPVPPTAVPTAVPAPTGAYAASASVSDGAPTWNEHVTVSGRLTRGGQPVAGATMHTIWNYKTTTSYCDGTTGSTGVASCERSISHATKGYTVVINVVFQDAGGGTLATTSTSFTPR